jgi:large subunit ribosomal protein L29
MQRAQHISDLRQMEISDLDARLKEVRTELFNLRFQAATGQLENHRQIRRVRRQIAQVLTVIQGRQLGFEEKVAQAPDSAVAPQAKPRRGSARAVAESETEAVAAESETEAAAAESETEAAAEPETEAAAEPETEAAAEPETEAAAEPEPGTEAAADAPAEATAESRATKPEAK